MPIPITADLVGATASVVVPVVGLAVAYLRLAMSHAIQGLKLDLIKDLNGTYIRRESCVLQHSGLASRVDKLEEIAADNAGRDYHVHRTQRHGEVED